MMHGVDHGSHQRFGNEKLRRDLASICGNWSGSPTGTSWIAVKAFTAREQTVSERVVVVELLIFLACRA